jgi:hypothetical protein
MARLAQQTRAASQTTFIDESIDQPTGLTVFTSEETGLITAECDGYISQSTPLSAV